jgi:hypothetical protein
MFTLYYAVNTCSLATHIALEDAGADYELRRIDFSDTEQQSPDYLKVKPKGARSGNCNASRNSDRDASDVGLHRPEFSGSGARSVE